MKQKLTTTGLLISGLALLLASGSLMYSELSPEDQQANITCSVVVGNGNGELPDIPTAINSLGNSLAGKTICVRNNKVYGQTTISNKSGTATDPLTIKAHPNNIGSNARAQIKDPAAFGTANAYQGAIQITNSKYLVLEGLEVAQAPAWGFNTIGSDNILLKNVVVHHNGRGTFRTAGSTNITIDGCQAYNYGTEQISNGPESINAIESKNVLVQNCKLWDEANKNGGAGVLSNLRSENVTYRNNEVHSPFIGPILHHDQSKNVVYENNLVVGYCSQGSSGTGFSALDEPYPEKAGATGPWRKSNTENLTVRNNLIVGVPGQGIALRGCQKKPGDGPGGANWIEGDCTAKNITVENNTVVGTGGASFMYGGNYDKPPQGLSIKNNIFHSAGSTISIGNPGTQYFSDNIWSKAPGFSNPSSDTIVNNLSGVFSSNMNLATCITDFDINKYKTTAAYNGKGADISKVGVKTSLPPIGKTDPTSTPSSTQATTPTPSPTNTKLPANTSAPSATTPQGNICGKADTDGNGVFTIGDFSEFARAYGSGKNTCADKDVDYGPCGGRDVNRDGVLNIFDFGGQGVGFAQRYYPKSSCAL